MSNPTADQPQTETAGEPSNAEELVHSNLSPTFDPAFVPGQNSELRRRLNLSAARGHDLPSEPDRQSYGMQASDISAERAQSLPAAGLQSLGQSSRRGENGAAVQLVSEPQIPSNGGAFIDHALRQRVEDDITAFLAAFDAALTHDTLESRAGLREATDRLLRAGARTRIELERLEARVPMPSRNIGKQFEPAWRHR